MISLRGHCNGRRNSGVGVKGLMGVVRLVSGSFGGIVSDGEVDKSGFRRTDDCRFERGIGSCRFRDPRDP